jgi:hypothetical protein
MSDLLGTKIAGSYDDLEVVEMFLHHVVDSLPSWYIKMWNANLVADPYWSKHYAGWSNIRDNDRRTWGDVLREAIDDYDRSYWGPVQDVIHGGPVRAHTFWQWVSKSDDPVELAEILPGLTEDMINEVFQGCVERGYNIDDCVPARFQAILKLSE